MSQAAFWVAWLLPVSIVIGADAPRYLVDVKPVLRARCYACHGALKQEAGLRLDTAREIVAGGDSGGAVQPGRPADSILLERVLSQDESIRMPPEGRPLSQDEIAAIRAWIAQGAPQPPGERSDAPAETHWAFLPPVTVSFPNASSTNPIDALLAQRRRQQHVQVLPRAEKSLLLRRVYLDLIGVPPLPEEIAAFVRDDRPDAFERIVQRLLHSPQYGERWARHWMDIWRYTDWYGLGAQLRNSQKHIWHWRDWIIESLNEDKGYDQMILEMLAADELYPTDHDRLRATGFLARNYYLFNRTTWLDKTIEHTAKGLLGLTFQCAKCHDHKYDPLTHADYYRFRAFFEPHQVRLDPVPGTTDLERDGLPRVFDARLDEPTFLHLRGNEQTPDKSAPMKPDVPAVFSLRMAAIEPIVLPAIAHSPRLQEFVLRDHLAKAHAAILDAEKKLQSAQVQLQQWEDDGDQRDLSMVFDKSAPVLRDAFDRFNKSNWKPGVGDPQVRSGALLLTAPGLQRSYFESRLDMPEDFMARLRFKTLGGTKWKSVGLSFDVASPDETTVYLSAVSPGAKLQVSYKTAGRQVFPPEAAVSRHVELNQPYELVVLARGRLVNVLLDGRLLVAYHLPVKRRPGKLQLFAFDASASFDEFLLCELPEDVQLTEKAASKPPGTRAEALAAVATAQRQLKFQQAQPLALETAHAADRAQAAANGSSPPQSLLLQAAEAAFRVRVTQAALAVAAARQKVLVAQKAPDQETARGELKAAEESYAKIQSEAVDAAAGYTSLQVSRKALEGPAESDASRRQPFPTSSSGRRSALARWIVDTNNPLTARVAVNHIWLRHFGQPLVEPVTDFGRRTGKPLHQDVLDFLALELIENDWSIKHIHQLIVTSATYQLSGKSLLADDATLASDPTNRFLWKRTCVRMEAQVIRDALLHLAGVMDQRVGGPTIDPQLDDTQGRRSLYFTRSRDATHAFLDMFDDADIFACYRRAESIVPQQALALSNSKLSLRLATSIADRIERRADLNDAQFAAAAFLMILCRAPNAAELDACVATLHDLREAAGSAGTQQLTHPERVNLVHALLNHNDFITIR